MQAAASQTHASSGTSASCVDCATKQKAVQQQRSTTAPSDNTVDHWKQPKWSQGFLWVRDAITCTLSVSYMEITPLFPNMPASELANTAAVVTISSHSHLFMIVRPIKTDRFEALLESHPNRLLVESVCRGGSGPMQTSTEMPPPHGTT